MNGPSQVPVLYENERVRIFQDDHGKAWGQEKPHRVLKDDRRIACDVSAGAWQPALHRCMEELGVYRDLEGADEVAVKINLGGGILGCPATYTDPVLLEALVEILQERGLSCFLCEADMRGQFIGERTLKRRQIPELLKKTGVRFVNLSQEPRVRIQAEGVDCPLEFPVVLLKPETRLINVTVPKGHWECGVSLSQKNLYGALSDARKSIYHRRYGRIDEVVAAAARILSPTLNILGGTFWGAGLGPHFCVPIRMDAVLAGRDMVRLDAYTAGLLGYPVEKVRHIQLNCRGESPESILTPGSRLPDTGQIGKLKKSGLRPWERAVWKGILFPQYFLPHKLQPPLYPMAEVVAGWINRAAFHTRGDNPGKITSPKQLTG